MAKSRTDREILDQIPGARMEGNRARRAEPRAANAHFDSKRQLVVVELTNGAFFGFPPELGEGLKGASAQQLAEVHVSPSGEGLHWESLDADLSVPAMLQGVFGGKAWMAELGRAGGQVRSRAKAAAARQNGLMGGRPRKAGGTGKESVRQALGRQKTDLGKAVSKDLILGTRDKDRHSTEKAISTKTTSRRKA